MALISLDEYLERIDGQFAGLVPQYDRAELPEAQPGLLGGSLRRGALGVGEDLSNVAGLGAQALGFDEVAQGMFEKAEEYANRREAIPRRVGRIEDVGSLKDLGVFAVESLVENAPLLASIAIPGVGASIGARLLGAGVKAARATGFVAGFLADIGLQTGESVGIAREEDQDPVDVRVVGSGIAKGALDFVPFLTIARQIGLTKGLPLGPLMERVIGKELVNKGFIRRAAGNVGAIVAREVPTEVAQEALNIALSRALTDFEGQLTDEEKSQLVNAAAGAAAFGLLGIPSAVFSPGAESAAPPPGADPKDLKVDGAGSPDSGAPPPGGPRLLTGPPPDQEGIRVVEGELIPRSDASVPGLLGLPPPAIDVEFERSNLPGLLGLTAPTRRPSLARVAAEEGVEVDVEDMLQEFGEQPISEFDKQQRWSNGELMFAFNEMDEQPSEITSMEMLNNYPPDAILSVSVDALPKVLREAFAGVGKMVRRDGTVLNVDKLEAPQASLQAAIAAELRGDPAPRAEAVVFTSDGAATTTYGLDGLSASANLVKGVPPIQRNEIDNAVLALEGVRQQDEKRVAREVSPAVEAAPVFPVAIQKLIDARDELLADENLRHPRTGNLTKTGKLKVQVVESRISAMAKRLGMKDPVSDLRVDNVKNAEAQMAEQERAASQEESRLSLGEQAVLEKLQEKEMFEGLTDREAERYVELLAKARGEERAPRAARSAAEIRAERRELEAIAREEVEAETVKAQRQVADYDIGGVRAKPKYSIEKVVEMINEIMAGFTNRPDVVVTRSAAAFKNFPGRQQYAREAGRIRGLFFRSEPDRIYIFSDLVESREGLIRTLLHETLHRGLQSFMSTEDRVRLLRMISSRFNLRDRVLEDFEREIATFKDPNTPKELKERIRKRLLRAIQPGSVESLGEAEEIIAELAETDPKSSLLDRIIALIAQSLRKVFRGLKITNAEIRNIIVDAGAYGRKFNRVPTRELNKTSVMFQRKRFAQTLGLSDKDLNDIVPGIEKNAKVWGQGFVNGVLTPLQISRRFGSIIPSARTYLETVQQWWARKRQLTVEPVRLTEDWSKYSKRDAEKFSKVVFEVSIRSEELGRKLEPQEVMNIMKRNGFDPKAEIGSRSIFKLWQDMDGSFAKIVEQMQDGVELVTIRQAVVDEGEARRLHNLWKTNRKAFLNDVMQKKFANLDLGGRLASLESEMAKLKQLNYFPHMRFGKYATTVRALEDTVVEGREYKKGQVVWFETAEKSGVQTDRLPELQKQFPKGSYEVQLGVLSDSEFTLLGIPPALYEVLKDKLGLSTEQTERLKELYYTRAPGRSFLRHLVRRRGIGGFSTDAMRVYASYMMNAANHLARVEFHQALDRELGHIREEARVAPDSRRAGVLSNYFNNHFDYIMKPENDWARLRAMGFLWYLGANVKSAFVNLTQVPMVAFPYLSTIYGSKATMASMFGALRQTTDVLRGKALFDPEVDADIKRAINDGFIDEAFATELAAIGEGDILNLFAPEGTSARVINRASYYGSFLFRHAEKFNRIVTFIATRQMAKARGLTGEPLYKAARDAVQTTMFEYAKWNRPEFMRGKKSVFFLFWQYMQHLSFLAYGGEGGKVAMRTWLMLMAAAGAQGLPFAENFFDIFDWTAKEVKELFGSNDPHTDVRSNLRELALTITDEPDLVMHGLSRYYGLGPMHFMSLFDVPVPKVDISGSLGTGEVIPGLSEAFSAERDPDKKMGRVLIDALGPVVGIGYSLWRVLQDDNPDTWKRWERAMPTAIQSVSKAFRREATGEEAFRGGGSVVRFEPQNMEHRLENVFQGLGFAPTRLNQRQELRYSQEQLRQYWTVRRATLIESFAYAQLGDDPEARDRALKKVRAYNKQVPAPQLMISPDTLSRSIRERLRRRALRETGIPNERAFVPLYRRIETLFPEGAAAVPGRSP